ncbi:hypothetical protein GDO81_007213 [Engystomops pustulosus]|uniref:Uncharacterized protein n=1 Tax=Engystomops pustulosus TaxID=76066 RepID=A0AAV7C6H0_ENGPU|nr:hypothetical protein GDO81_007213 [Engystomops pustulosus]
MVCPRVSTIKLNGKMADNIIRPNRTPKVNRCIRFSLCLTNDGLVISYSYLFGRHWDRFTYPVHSRSSSAFSAVDSGPAGIH